MKAGEIVFYIGPEPGHCDEGVPSDWRGYYTIVDPDPDCPTIENDAMGQIIVDPSRIEKVAP